MAAAIGYYDPNLHPLLACLADTGARLGEGLALRLSDLDATRCATRIDKAVSQPPKAYGGLHVKDTKTHNKRTIAIHHETTRILLAHAERCRALAAAAGVPFPENPMLFPDFVGRRLTIALEQPCSPTKKSKVVSEFFASLEMSFHGQEPPRLRCHQLAQGPRARRRSTRPGRP
jgi:integrase